MTELNADSLYSRLIAEGFDAEWAEDDSELILPCPLCSDDRRRCYVSTDSGTWICFRCDEHGGLYDLLHRVLDLPGPEAMDAVRLYTRATKDDPFAQMSAPQKLPDFAGVALPEEYTLVTDSAPPGVLKYLARRHIPAQLATDRRIGFCRTGMYSARIVVPVYSEGVLYTFVARSVYKRCPGCDERIEDCECECPFRKVLTPEGGKPSLTLYNVDQVRSYDGRRLVITEGVFDALRLPNEAVAILGSSVSPRQVEMLADLARGRDVISCLDGDKVGRAKTRKMVDALASSLVKVRIASLPDGSDPSSLPQQELEDCLAAARLYILA